MKAVRIHRFGGPEVLTFDTLPIPEPRDGEVVVKVFAASVNPVDYKIREGRYPAVREGQLPVVMGRDVSGVIEHCGGHAGDFKEGDLVFAMLGQERGAQAEYVLVKTGELARKPDELSHVEAAAVPLAGLTAAGSLVEPERMASPSTLPAKSLLSEPRSGSPFMPHDATSTAG